MRDVFCFVLLNLGLESSREMGTLRMGIPAKNFDVGGRSSDGRLRGVLGGAVDDDGGRAIEVAAGPEGSEQDRVEAARDVDPIRAPAAPRHGAPRRWFHTQRRRCPYRHFVRQFGGEAHILVVYYQLNPVGTSTAQYSVLQSAAM